MENLQNLRNDKSIDLLPKIIYAKGRELLKRIRFKNGCEISECEILTILYLERLVCDPPCYMTESMDQKVRDYLIKINKNG